MTCHTALMLVPLLSFECVLSFGQPSLVASPNSLTIEIVYGLVPEGQVHVTSTGSPITFSASASGTVGVVGPINIGSTVQGTTPAALQVDVMPGYAPGTYLAGNVTIVATGVGNSPIVVPVT